MPTHSADRSKLRNRLARLMRAWRWWQIAAFLSAIGVIAATIASPLDRYGKQDLLVAHVVQHVSLGDLAAPLLLLGLPEPGRRWLRVTLTGLADARTLAGRVLTALLSPVGAMLVWATVVYLWFVPGLHLTAVRGGPVHVVDHVSFLCAGLLVWLGTFDPRPTRAIHDALRLGGLPWWGRHVYAMVTRLALLPPSIAVWLSSGSTYHRGSGPLPFGVSLGGDQARAASVMIGFEMLLFGLAVVLAFIFLSISEGRARAEAR